MRTNRHQGVMIGLEIHVPLPTRSKLFCECPNDKNAPPNTNVCPTCLGLPGAKPLLNESALMEALKVALALECEIESETFFARKTYFYPDLPKNYQITQHQSAIGRNGKITLLSANRIIRIGRVHLEEDPASMKHLADGRTLIDHNRSGTPLVEVVTDPDFRRVDEVIEFLDLFFGILRYLGHSHPETDVRCDLNVSLQGGARVEIKNVSGIKTARKGLMFEIRKQMKLIKAGKKIKRVTLMFDAKRGITVPIRDKEYEEDYGYIFEPDLVTYALVSRVQRIKLPRLPTSLIKEYLAKYRVEHVNEQRLVVNLALTGPSWGLLLDKIANAFGHEPRILNFLVMLAKKHDDQVPTKLIQEKYWISFQKIIQRLLEGQVPVGVLEENVLQLVERGEFSEDLHDNHLEERIQLVEQLINEYFNKHPDHWEQVKTNPKFINHVIGQVIRESGRKDLAKLIQEGLTRRIRNH